MTSSIFLIVLAFVFTLAAISYFLYINNQTKQLTKTPEKESDVPSQEEYSHIIVHELRAPLTVIKDSASILLSDKLNEGEQKKMLNLIHDQANKLLNQISIILDVAKVQGGKLTLKKTEGNIGNVVKEEITLFEPEAKRKNINLIANIKGDLPTFFFDNVRITEAVNNILSNSLKYTNENGKITVEVNSDGGNIIITVSDNGIGIPKEKQSVLFTKFGEVNNNTNKQSPKLSSGLGLYITKWIIETHGGTIKIDSEEGKGTTTTITLPIDANMPRASVSSLT